jgi:hypothetical protein
LAWSRTGGSPAGKPSPSDKGRPKMSKQCQEVCKKECFGWDWPFCSSAKWQCGCGGGPMGDNPLTSWWS